MLHAISARVRHVASPARLVALLLTIAAMDTPLPAPAADVVKDRLKVSSRSGVTNIVEIAVPSGAPAMVLLFEGGGGAISGSKKGFVGRAKDILVEKGVAAALLDAPSDQRNFMGGMHPYFRASSDHLADVDAVIASLKGKYRLPIWVLGISLGTRSAAYYAVERLANVDGVVLLSSSTSNPKAPPVYNFGLDRLTVPVLAIAHESDACRGTPPSGARKIVSAARNSPDAVVKIFSGGKNRGRQPCGIDTYHTFNGIESMVASEIASFIMKHAR